MHPIHAGPAQRISNVKITPTIANGTTFSLCLSLRGRRAVFLPVILIMAGATAAVGFLPGYAIIGILAPITLIMLRAAQGLAAGGELGVAAILILERAS